MNDWTITTQWTGSRVTVGVLRELLQAAVGMPDETEVRVSVDRGTNEPNGMRTVTIALQGGLRPPLRPETSPLPYYPPGVRGVEK